MQRRSANERGHDADGLFAFEEDEPLGKDQHAAAGLLGQHSDTDESDESEDVHAATGWKVHSPTLGRRVKDKKDSVNIVSASLPNADNTGEEGRRFREMYGVGNGRNVGAASGVAGVGSDIGGVSWSSRISSSDEEYDEHTGTGGWPPSGGRLGNTNNSCAKSGVCEPATESANGGLRGVAGFAGLKSHDVRPIIGSAPHDHRLHDHHVSWGHTDIVQFAQLLPVNHGRSKKAKKKAARQRRLQAEAAALGLEYVPPPENSARSRASSQGSIKSGPLRASLPTVLDNPGFVQRAIVLGDSI